LLDEHRTGTFYSRPPDSLSSGRRLSRFRHGLADFSEPVTQDAVVLVIDRSLGWNGWRSWIPVRGATWGTYRHGPQRSARFPRGPPPLLHELRSLLFVSDGEEPPELVKRYAAEQEASGRRAVAMRTAASYIRHYGPIVMKR
jgi:hypothetical protein